MDVWSEYVRPSGGRLENPRALDSGLTRAELLVRETIQNTWDARDPDRSGSVEYHLGLRRLGDAEAASLRQLVPDTELPGLPRPAAGVADPAAVVREDHVDVLVVRDRGTVGLTGRTRTGGALGDRRRFVSFVRNSGRLSSMVGDGDGGSYGVGKSVVWQASRCGLVVVHSMTTDEHGTPVERLIAIVHGPSHETSEYTYTGRHFLGRRANDDPDLIEPLTGEEARATASSLGLVDLDRTGTTLMIVAPRIGGADGAAKLRDALRWHCWPHLTSGLAAAKAPPNIVATVTCDGTDHSPVDPGRDPEVGPYARTLRDAHRNIPHPSGDPRHDQQLVWSRSKEELGWLRVRDAGKENVFHVTAPDEDDRRAPNCPLPAPWGHVARIRRGALLLVDYVPLPQHDRTGHEVGVYLSADDPHIEHALTLAEPPAHDRWNPRLLDRRHPDGSLNRDEQRARKTVELLEDAIRHLEAPDTPVAAEATGAARLAARLTGGLLGGGGFGGRASRSATSGGGGASVGRQRPRLELRHRRDLREVRDGVTIDTIDVLVHGDGRVRLTASTAVYDGSRSIEDAVVKPVLHWVQDGRTDGGDSVDVTAPTQLALTVEIADEVRLRPTVTAEWLTT